MEIVNKGNGKVRITPSLESNWLYNGRGSFGKVVSCRDINIYVWEEVTNDFKEEWEETERKRQEAEFAENSDYSDIETDKEIEVIEEIEDEFIA